MGGFESRVILDGSQTYYDNARSLKSFESRVILDGSQTEQQLRLNTYDVWESCYFRW